MGAASFVTIGKGPTMREAFNAAQRDALYWHGHGGYSGTIAEKPGAVQVGRAREGATADEVGRAVQDWSWWREQVQMHAWREVEGYSLEGYEPGPEPEALRELVPGIDLERTFTLWADKWDDAIAILLAPDEWLFTGLASE